MNTLQNNKTEEKKVEIVACFRTHDKYSKRLYFAFKPLWYILHALDWAMLDRIEYAARFSFGFSTLTQYPGSIGAGNKMDGRFSRTGIDEAWATIIAGAGTANSTTASSQYFEIVASA